MSVDPYAEARDYADDLVTTHDQAMAVLDRLADFGAPSALRPPHIPRPDLSSDSRRRTEEHATQERDPVFDDEGVEDELRDFDPTKEGGSGPCKRCGAAMDPWVFATVCTGCLWDERSPVTGEQEPTR